MISDDMSYEELFEETIPKNSDFWEKYLYDKVENENINLRTESIKNLIEVSIPKKNNPRYEHIRMLESTHLNNNRMALELIIRDSEFRKLFVNYLYMGDLDSRFINAKELKEKFGFNVQDIMKLKISIPYMNEIDCPNPNQDEYIITNSPFISDIEGGLFRVIKFYHRKKKLYLLGDPNYLEDPTITEDNIYKNDINKLRDIVFVKVDKINTGQMYVDYKKFIFNRKLYDRLDEKFYKMYPSEKLVKNIEEVYLNYNIDNVAIKVEINGKKVMNLLTEDNFSLKLLDKEFFETLSDEEKTRIEIEAEPSLVEYYIPMLSIVGSKHINFHINIDASIDEIIESIKKLKKYENIIKSPSEILFNKERRNEICTVSSKVLSKGKKKIVNFADALYVYDLYKIINEEFEKKKEEIDKEEKKNPNKFRDENINFQKGLFNKTAIYRLISEITAFPESIVKERINLIKRYIEKREFKNILLGNLQIK